MMTKVPIELGHTCMNHFVIIDYRGMQSPPDETLADLAEILCATSIADDLLVLQSSDHADVRLRIFGGDRLEADFCGNGMVYIAAKIGVELNRDKVTIESACGIKTATHLGNQWKVEIGSAIKLQQALETAEQATINKLSVYGLLRAGEPHLVVFHPEELEGFHAPRKEFEAFCRPLCDITDIPGGVSITVVFQIKYRSLLIRTFERGARRQTFSCGTGSVAAVAAVLGTPEEDSQFHVCAPGGAHDIIFENARWYLLASPQRVGEGCLKDGSIQLPLDSLLPYKA